ncbi:MAG: hypothetical protein IT428_25755 [Planctomycetaceae bacterium]|nr:hypothetical protein [Planctomycetaceae bacterium]
MKQVYDDLVRRLANESGLSLEDCFWGTLVFCLVFSATHLLSMLITRWGDKQATGKSMAFSIAAHAALIMGAFGATLKGTSSELEHGEQTVIPVRNVVIESDEGPVTAGGGEKTRESAVFDRVPDMEGGGSRAERQPRTSDAPTVLDEFTMARKDLPIARVEPGLLPMSVSPLAATPAPIAELPAEVTPAPRVAAPLEEAGPQPESRSEGTIPGSGPARKSGPRDGSPEPQIARKVDVGGTGGALDRLIAAGDPARDPLLTLDPKTNGSGPRASAPALDSALAKAPADIPLPAPLDPAMKGGTPAVSVPGAVGEGNGGDGGGIRRRNVRGSAESGDDIRRPPRSLTDGGGAPEGIVSARNRTSFDSPNPVRAPGVQRGDDGPLNLRGNNGVPATYRLRNLARRREIARKYGGTEASERAVESALAWFASVQEPDGSWDGDRFGAGQVKVDDNGVDREFAGRDSDSGLTALVILAYLGAGYTHEEGTYSPNVDKALRWLVSQQREDGFLGGRATHYAQMYCHGMSTYALAEAYGMQSDPTSDPTLRAALKKAIDYTLDMQNSSDGGWRYVKGQKSDMSMFGWQLMALKSAEIAGIRIPDDVRNRMVQFLKDRSRGDSNGLAGYRAESPVSPSMTAEALFCKQMLGISRQNAQCREAVQYLLARLPKRSETDEYYWYYGTLAMYQYGGNAWTQWNDQLRELLLSEQETSGSAAGSWEPRGTWSRYGGRIYQTALNTLCLEVYYRFLPLHQLNGLEDPPPK